MTNKPKTSFIPDFKMAERRFHRRWLRQLLRECKGNVVEAARVSGLTRPGIYKKANKLKINLDEFRTEQA